MTIKGYNPGRVDGIFSVKTMEAYAGLSLRPRLILDTTKSLIGRLMHSYEKSGAADAVPLFSNYLFALKSLLPICFRLQVLSFGLHFVKLTYGCRAP